METYKEYADIQKQINLLEDRKEALRAKITLELPAEGTENDFVKAIWKTKRKWAYSPAVDSLKEALDTQKDKEEREGIAKAEETKELNIKIK